MGAISERAAMNNSDAIRESAMLDMYKNDKNFRADRLIESWSKVPEIGQGLKEMPVNLARNVAMNLDRQHAFMSNLKEAQMSTALNDFTPENMLRLVRLAMPNIIRNQVFQEFALETTKDSIKYCRPFWSKTANGHTLNDRDPNYDPFNQDADYDPWDYDNGDASFNGDTFRKALYEDTRDRANQELANGIVVASENGTVGTEQATVAAGGSEIALVFDAETAQKLAISDNAKFEAGKWGAAGKNLIDGYTVIYGVNPGDKGPNTEQQLIGMQDTRSGQFFSAPGFTVELVKAANVRDKFLTPSKSGVNQFPGTTELAEVLKTTGVYVVQITPDADVEKKAPWFKAGETKVAAFARYTSEGDFEGNYLGEVEIALTDYTFKPSLSSIGVKWTTLTEVTLDTSLNLSAEELLVDYSSQAIRTALDIRAFRYAYGIAKTNAKHNPNYCYHFDAAYNTQQNVTDASGNTVTQGAKDPYIANAATFVNAIDAVGDTIYDELKRGGVSRLVAGPSACSYLRLYPGFSAKGKQNNAGPHKFGEVDGMPLFKVPSDVIPTNEVLCVWKDDQIANDVSIAFGTLVPFISTGIIQRKNFYKEAAIGTLGDYRCLNRRYLALIVIDNLKDANNKMTRA